MEICIAGKNNIAVAVCSYLLEKHPDWNVITIKNKTDQGTDGFQRSFWKFAKERCLPVVTLEEVYSIPELIFLSLEFDRIIVPDRFLSNKLFNIHFSLLPRYKGMYTSVLPILHGRKKSGVTLHCIDAGIDTGDIIGQQEILLSPDETSKSLYEKCMKVGTSLVIENIDALVSNTFTAIPQKSEDSSYYSKSALNYADLQLDLNVTAFQLASQIRAFHFRDYQLPKLYGYEVVAAVITDERSTSKPGQILEDTEDFIYLATIDYNLRVYKDRFSDLLKYCETDDLHHLQGVPVLKYYLSENEPDHGWTPLMVAAYHNALGVCQYLIEQGADVNARNYKGTTVIMYAKDAALRTGNYAIVDLLLKSGANPYITDYSGKNLFDYLKNQSVTLFNYIQKNG